MMGAANYVEFNSTVLSPGQPRRIRLYQVAGVVGARAFYDDVSPAQMAEWARRYNVQASHLCRFVDFDDDRVVDADGQSRLVPVVRENKRCFSSEHVILEHPAYNRSRIACVGGSGCRHMPECIVVSRPS